jgi:hypothetical protein
MSATSSGMLTPAGSVGPTSDCVGPTHVKARGSHERPHGLGWGMQHMEWRVVAAPGLAKRARRATRTWTATSAPAPMLGRAAWLEGASEVCPRLVRVAESMTRDGWRQIARWGVTPTLASTGEVMPMM